MSDVSRTGDGIQRSIVITGASSGIGRATALRLARAGWRVFATVRKEKDAATIKAETDGAVETVQLDVMDKSSIADAARDVAARLGGRGLDALFNNAGIGDVFSTEYASLDTLRKIYEVNLFGQIAVIQVAVAPDTDGEGTHHKQRLGRRPHRATLRGSPLQLQSGICIDERRAQIGAAAQGIYVCIIEPGAINTPAVDKTLGGVEQAIAEMPAAGVRLYGEAMRRMARTFIKNERDRKPT